MAHFSRCNFGLNNCSTNSFAVHQIGVALCTQRHGIGFTSRATRTSGRSDIAERNNDHLLPQLSRPDTVGDTRRLSPRSAAWFFCARDPSWPDFQLNLTRISGIASVRAVATTDSAAANEVCVAHGRCVRIRAVAQRNGTPVPGCQVRLT